MSGAAYFRNIKVKRFSFANEFGKVAEDHTDGSQDNAQESKATGNIVANI